MARDITKFAVKTVAVTLLSVLGLTAVLFLILSFTAPAAMARLTLELHMYKQSAWYSSLQYAEGKGNISYIELAMNSCALINDEEGVIKYGSRFIADGRFAEYSAKREAEEQDKNYTEVYTQYIYGRLCVAYYRTEEDETALALAFSVNTDGFEEYNAVTDLANEAILSGDKTFAAQILSRLIILRDADKAGDVQYLEKTIQTLTDFTS